MGFQDAKMIVSYTWQTTKHCRNIGTLSINHRYLPLSTSPPVISFRFIFHHCVGLTGKQQLYNFISRKANKGILTLQQRTDMLYSVST
jgi:hypothetical protein